MSEVLLQVLVEKISAYQNQAEEIKEMIQSLPDYTPALWQANQRIDAIQAEIKNIPARISIPEKALLELKGELGAHRGQLQHPLKQQVRHHHQLSKPIWVCAGLTAIVIILISVLVLAIDQARQHKAADIKYRYLRLYSSGELLHDLDDLDGEYQATPDDLQKKVEQEEKHRQEVYEASRRAIDANNNLNNLKGTPKGGRAGSSGRKDQ